MNEAASKLGVHTMSASDLESLRAGRMFLMVMGVALIILGAVAMGSSFIATLATVRMFGLVLCKTRKRNAIHFALLPFAKEQP